MRKSPFIFQGASALNLAPSIKNYIQATVEIPQAGTAILYPKADGFWYAMFSDGIEKKVGGGVETLNGIATDNQSFATGTTGTDFNIVSAGSTHTFNIPNASTTARGLITTGAQTLAGEKSLTSQLIVSNGTAVAPGISISGNSATGIFSPALDVISLTVNGTERLRAGTSFTESYSRLLNVNGSVEFPAYSFSNFLNSGMFHDSFGVGLSVSGLRGIYTTGTATTISGNLTLGTQTNKATVQYTTNTTRTFTLPNVPNNAFLISSPVALGTNGQVLQSNGSEAVWVNLPGGGIQSINTVTAINQTMVTGTTGTDFNITFSGSEHRFNLPDASATARGVVTTGAQTFAGSKTHTGTVNIINGTAVAPALAFSSDSTTGIFSPSTGSFGISTNGVQRININSGGNVTIGSAGFTSFHTLNGILSLGTAANKASIVYSTNAARTYNIPNVVDNAIFIMSESAQTINGAKTFTSTIVGSISGNAATATTANSVANTLTRGTYLTGANFNGSAATTWAVDATSANTADKVVARDVSGNFAAGTITASFSGQLTSRAATSVVGRSANSIGNTADIAAAFNDTVLMRTANALSFSQISDVQISSSAAITRTKLATGTTHRVLVNDGSGNITELPSGTSGQILTSQGAGVAPIWATGGGGGIQSLNGLTASTQTFATGTSGTDFSISSAGSVHTFNIPNASTTARGLVSTGAQTYTGIKSFDSVTRFADGTAALPSLTFSSSPSTGIYLPAGNAMAITIGGVERMRINDTGAISSSQNHRGGGGLVPVGTIVAFNGGHYTNNANAGYTAGFLVANTVAGANTLLNAAGWYVCDGAAVNVAASPIWNAGSRHLPNLTGNRFLMGSTTAGTAAGNSGNTINLQHGHTASSATADATWSSSTYTIPAEDYTRPSMPAHRHSASATGATINVTSSGAHTHTVPIAGSGDGDSSGRFRHTDSFSKNFNVQSTNSEHTHPAANVTGLVGLGAGSDGDTATVTTGGSVRFNKNIMNSNQISHSHTISVNQSLSTTQSILPQYLSTLFIIRVF